MKLRLLFVLTAAGLLATAHADQPRRMAIDVPPYNHMIVHAISLSTKEGLLSRHVNEDRLRKYPEYVIESREIAYINQVYAAITSLPSAQECVVDNNLAWMMLLEADGAWAKFVSDGRVVKGGDGECWKLPAGGEDFDVVRDLARGSGSQ